MRLKYYFLLPFILLYSCNNNSFSEEMKNDYYNAIELRKDKNLMVSINLFEKIFTNSPQSKYAPMSLYQIGDIYLNDIKNYDLALSYFKKLNRIFPNSESGKIALFLCGYISNNYLQEFSSAFDYYNSFKDLYPNDSLIFSVDYELYDPNTGLINFIQVIDSLNNQL